MTGQLRNCRFRRVYEASDSNLIEDFYIPAMMRATRYDRAVGYFRSSIFHLVQIAVSDFILRGGKMRMICSTSLDEADEQVIRDSLADSNRIDDAIVQEIMASLRVPTLLPILELLATMIKIEVLDLRVAYKANETGIFHAKVGIFYDDNSDAVSFDGSANETFMAWSHNEERFRTFCTWKSGGREPVQDDQRYFEELWEGKRPSLLVRPLPEVAKRLLAQYANPDPQAAVEKVRSLARPSTTTVQTPPKQLQDHQVAVLTSWRKTKSGIIDHVTGGGKTVTALACVRDWFSSVPKASALIVVPSDLLTQQWRSEIRSELVSLDPRILHAGGSRSHLQWPDLLRSYLQELTSSQSRIVVATMDTAATDRFLNLADVGKNTILVVDEVHKVGAPSRRKLLALNPGAKLGLSATPQRFGDPEGTAAIFEFFGNILEPRFSISDAQMTTPPRLVPYTYDFGTVALSATEAVQYQRLTKSIGALWNQVQNESRSDLQEMLRQLRLKRARIVKSASDKVRHGVTTLQERFTDGDRWLVYCDTTQQLESLAEELNAIGISSTRYLAAMDSSKHETIDRFQRFGGVLLSIRCLDEGIDIPLVSHALILASSLNPREHIQRRGRVLRTAPSKADAEIYDTLVGTRDEETIKVFDHEISRAQEFASDARNGSNARWKLDRLARVADPEWADLEVDEHGGQEQ